jgi:hypothetical protein
VGACGRADRRRREEEEDEGGREERLEAKSKGASTDSPGTPHTNTHTHFVCHATSFTMALTLAKTNAMGVRVQTARPAGEFASIDRVQKDSRFARPARPA